MQKTYLLLSLTAAVFLCGCNKQEKINSAKIDLLSQKIVQLEQNQSKQMTVIQSQLVSLTPMLDKMNDFYFEKSHDEAFFYHTNTLYLLLTVGQKIEGQLQLADVERDAEKSLAYSYHTNQLDALSLCVSQIQNALTDQEKRIEENINVETAQKITSANDELLKQIKSSAPDADDLARLKKMEIEVAQIQRDLDAIKTQLGITNQPTMRP